MKAISLFLVITTMLLTGCGEGGSASGSNPTPAPQDYLNNLVQAEKQATKTVDATAVNKAIERFYIEEGSFPKDLLELVEKGFIPRIPKLPAGLNWQYDTNDGVVTIIKDSAVTD